MYHSFLLITKEEEEEREEEGKKRTTKEEEKEEKGQKKKENLGRLLNPAANDPWLCFFFVVLFLGFVDCKDQGYSEFFWFLAFFCGCLEF